MVKSIRFIPIYFFILFFSIFSLFAQEIPVSKDFSILLSAEVQKEPNPQITINWQAVKYAKTYTIYKKMKTTGTWSLPLANLDSNTTSYTDTKVEVGETYEYKVISNSETIITSGGKTGPFKFSATGYIYSGIEVPPITFGKVLLLIDETMRDPLSVEIDRLINDLVSEGWTVATEYVPRTEAFDGNAAKQIKNIIIAEYNKAPNNLQAVFIIGRVAVPYSGDYRTDYTQPWPPDGHPDHGGAWPCDMYYGIMNESIWTDNTANDTIPGRDRNDNIPGDGKFDFTFMSDLRINVELQVGRVDFYNLPAFENSETELLKKYLDKDHNYRKGLLTIKRQGLICDNLPPKNFSYTECTAACGWRNFGDLFGSDKISSVESKQWVTSLENNSYLMGYGCGYGGFTGVGGVVNTSDYASSQMQAVFTMHFGSYSGDWDSENNVIRAAIASSPSILTCAWVGRPHWYLHKMALGETIGSALVLSQNNWDTYTTGYYYEKPDQEYNSAYSYKYGNRQIHVALMGDPTLTVNMGGDLAGNIDGTLPPKNLSVVQLPAFKVKLSWEAPEESGDIFYNVYESDNPNGGFVKINDEPIIDTEFTTTKEYDGEMYYMVRTGKLRENNSGSYYHLSDGIIQSVILSDAGDIAQFDFAIDIAPNPAKSYTNISLVINRTGLTTIEIYSIGGNLINRILSSEISKGTHKFVWNLTNYEGQRVQTGIYLVKISSGTYCQISKIVVMP